MKEHIQDYYHRNVGLVELYPFIGLTADMIGKKTQIQHYEFLENETEKKEGNEKEATFVIPFSQMGRHHSFLGKIKAHDLSKEILPQALVVALVSQFDLFVARAVRYIFNKKPLMLKAIEKNITYAEIDALGDLEKVKEYLIEKEIECLLRESHIDQIGWFEKKLSTKLQTDQKLIADFVEITQRRNLFVHSDGIVSQQYISKCREYGQDCEGMKAGDKLTVTQEYFSHVSDRLVEIGCKLGQIIWRKIEPEERLKANEALNELTFDLINNGRHKAAADILKLFLEEKKNFALDDVNEYIVIMNYAQAQKWAGNQTECRKILSGVTWQSKRDDFLLISLVLLDEYDEASRVMKLLGKERHTINKVNYQYWPIFKEFRKSDIFLKTFKEIYGEDFKDQKSEYRPAPLPKITKGPA